MVFRGTEMNKECKTGVDHCRSASLMGSWELSRYKFVHHAPFPVAPLPSLFPALSRVDLDLVM